MLLSLVNIVTIHSLTNQRWSLECFHWPSHRLSLHTYVPYVQTLPTLGVIETGGWFDDPCLAPNWDIITDIKLSYLVFCCWQKMQKKKIDIQYWFPSIHTHTHTHSNLVWTVRRWRRCVPIVLRSCLILQIDAVRYNTPHRSHTHTHFNHAHFLMTAPCNECKHCLHAPLKTSS